MAGSRVAFVKRTIRRKSVRQGLLGGSRPWLVMWGFLQLAKWSGKVTKRGEGPVRFGEHLQPGESFVIEHIAPPKKARRRKGAPPA